jgi:mannose-6-phosphate isomerase
MKPIRIYPVAKDYLWGGVRLREQFGKNFPLDKVAETWELSLHKDGESMTEDGTPLSRAIPKEAFGAHIEDFPFFPMLIKFIDASDNLSIQVHPSDTYALANENSFGKTEMWYIVDATEGAGIYLGLKETTSREAFECAIRENRLCNILNFYPVKAGECYFIPAGTVHAIGKGCLIYEIQQSSNITYRVYDYGRVGKDGKPRELHIDKAIEVSTLTKYEAPKFDDGVLGSCEYFTAKKFTIDGGRVLTATDLSFHAITVIEGSGSVAGISFNKGDTLFIPAGYGKYEINGKAEVIVTSV